MLTRDLLEALLKFRQEREWERFHTPKNLSAAIVVEAAELLECFQWTADSDLETLLTDERQAIEHEVADIAILLSYFCNDLGIDLDEAVQRKLELNRSKYPLKWRVEPQRNMTASEVSTTPTPANSPSSAASPSSRRA